MEVIATGIAFCALLTLNALLVLTVFTKFLTLWPAPDDDSWQSHTFWPLFRIGLGLTILIGVWQFAVAESHGLGAVAGVPLALLALGFTVYGYFDLGIDKTYGADDSLVTTGLYRYSRNPQYVASIIGFTGLAIAVATPEIILLSALAILVYTLMTYAEEPWLEKIYGEEYRAYEARTPRFLSLTKLFEKPLATSR
ncbi:MAG: phosphatidylethanolamine N-methyltransferase family protein [Hyphomicrobiales bacterium]|nr:phosphatidylethanolamine N-methyltransferase family protein [Hyphomicrobiales bacterium]